MAPFPCQPRNTSFSQLQKQTPPLDGRDNQGKYHCIALVITGLTLTLFMTGCDAIGGIFKAGAYTGIIGVVTVVAVLIWLASKFLGGGGNRNV